MSRFAKELLLHLAERGYQGRIVSIQHLRDLQEEIEGYYKKGLLDEEFSQEETALLLEGATHDRLPAATVRKLEQLDLIEYLDSLPRNLGVSFRESEH